jgi:two-component sensor histidine kinase/CHASE3 domain sensor protein
VPITSRFVVRSTIVLLGVGFAALFAIVVTTVWLGQRAQYVFDDATDARDKRISAAELRDALRTAESSQRGYLLSGNEIYLAPYDNAKTLALRHLDRLIRGLEGQIERAPMLRRLTAVVTDKIAEMDQTIGLKSDHKDLEASALFRTNRGKALMDEANVFLYGIVLLADERLTIDVAEQRENAAMLRWVSLVGALLILFVVGGVVVTIARYARENSQARDEVQLLNSSLEDRVTRRTFDLAQARDRAEVLLAEVNHRVANSLALVASLVKLQSKAVNDQAAKDALAETQGRIYAISLIHKRLYTSGDARFVALDEYLAGLLEHLETSMRAEGHGASLRYEIEPLKLRTDRSVNLGVVVTEWVTNAFKYAYPSHPGEVRVRLKASLDGRAELLVEDDGIGRSVELAPKGTGLGTRIVNAMAATMGAELEYLPRQPGTTARLVFALPLEQ